MNAYEVPRAAAPTDLKLDANEGPAPSMDLLDAITLDDLRRYPSGAALEAELAERLGVRPDQVLVTAGADDALDRCCRAALNPGDRVVLPRPGFSMVPRYVGLAGAEIVEVPWLPGGWPSVDVADAAMVVMTHPNNPTGAVVTEDELNAVRGAFDGLLVVDLAYVEFADVDLTAAGVDLPRTVVLRTFSKAWGLAGLRVGYAVGDAEVIRKLRACGAPFAVSGPSLAMAAVAARTPPASEYVAQVRAERAALATTLSEVGARPWPSQANFVFATPARRTPLEALDDTDGAWSLWVRDGLAGLGIAVRAFPGEQDGVRISCPGNPTDFARLASGLGAVLRPEALLFDLDGVFADVSASYRTAIVRAAADFGVQVDAEDITAAKRAGNANNDWVVTQRLCAARGVEVTLEAVTERFEAHYQGGLWKQERLLVDLAWLSALPLPWAIVTGRPRRDAERFLAHFGVTGLSALICMEDGPAKPDPTPVKLALQALGVSRAWMVGDTPDDMRAARAAGVVPIGVPAPGETGAALPAAGAARVLPDVTALIDLLEVQ